MTTIRLLIFCLLVLASISRSEAAQNPVMLYWDELVQPGDFKKALDAFCGGPKHDWPAVFSMKYSSSLEEPVVAEQVKLRELSETLLRGLETYEAVMRTNALPNFVSQSDALLAMRRQLERNPSYANLVLIDSINRVLFVNLAERMTARDTLSPDLVRLAKHLADFHPDLEQLRTVAEKETRRTLVAQEKFTGTDRDRFRGLWDALEPNTNPMFPRNADAIGSHALLKGQEIPVLLNRLSLSDYYIRSSLPALIAYRQKAPAYSPTDDYQRIKNVMGQEAKVSPSLGVEIAGPKRAASAVNELLQDVRSGRVRSRLLFSSPTVESSK